MNYLKNKKILILSLVTVVVLMFLYWFFSGTVNPAKQSQTTTSTGITGKVGSLSSEQLSGQSNSILNSQEIIPEEYKDKLTQITNFSVVSASLNKTRDKILYHKKDGGDLYSSDLNGQNQEKLSRITVVNMTEVIWSPARDRTAVFYLDGETLKGFIQVGTSSVTVLPQNIKSFSWSPDGNSLAYLLQNENKLDLTIANSTGKNQRVVYSTPMLDVQITWSSVDKILLKTAPSGFSENYVFVYSINSQALTKLIGPYFGMMINTGFGAGDIIFSRTNANGAAPRIYLGNISSGFDFRVNRNTISAKCVWASADKVYCATPSIYNPDVVWPDDYLMGIYNSGDFIESFDVKNNETSNILKGNFDVSNLIVMPDESYLFFINRIDGTLWSFKLK